MPSMLQIGDEHTQWIIDVRTVDIIPLKPFLESRKLLKVGHNIKYDYQVLKNIGITIENVYDTMLGEQVRYTGLKQAKGFYTLEETLERYTNRTPYNDQLSLFAPWIPKSRRSLVGSMEQFDYAAVYYGATDVESTSLVYSLQKQYLIESDLHRVHRLENKFCLVVGDMELNGIHLDVDRWLELEEWAIEKRDNILEELHSEYPEVENWNSHIQVKKLFKSLGISVVSKDGKESIQELVIKDQEHPIIDKYLSYKGFSKLVSTYGVKFLKHLSPDDRIRSNFMQILVTGRTSSTSPNMQNIVSEKSDFPEGKW